MGYNSYLFLNWLEKNDPLMYAVAERAYALQQSGLSAFNIGDFLKSAISTVTTIAPKVMEYNQQKKLLDVQIARAKQNLPPLDTTNYQVVQTYNPNSPQQQAYVDQLARESISTQQSTGLTQLMPFILIGGFGLLAVKMIKSK